MDVLNALMDLVNLETSVISHATAAISTDQVTAALQTQARRWMAEQRPKFRVVASSFVWEEAARGDQTYAARRLALLADVELLEPNPDCDAVADELLNHALMPKQARLDALHVAAAALAGVQYLLTQNLRHIANARTLPRIYRLLDDLGLSGVLICTPAQFLGGNFNGSESNPG